MPPIVPLSTTLILGGKNGVYGTPTPTLFESLYRMIYMDGFKLKICQPGKFCYGNSDMVALEMSPGIHKIRNLRLTIT